MKEIIAKMKGFTMIELTVTIGIMLALFMVAIPGFRQYQKNTNISSEAEAIISALRQANVKTISAEGQKQWGVMFSTSTTPHSYTLFRGTSSVARDPDFDRDHVMPGNISISMIDFNGDREVVFDRINGNTTQTGYLTIESDDTIPIVQSIYVNEAGQVALSPFASTDDRIKDARHVHFAYSRIINTATETLTLRFSGGVVENIILNNNIVNGQVFWQGEVEVGGAAQRITIQSHRLNIPDTLFSVHRDRRHNTVALEIDLSGDAGATPQLMSFSADGLTTNIGNSIFVSAPEWQ